MLKNQDKEARRVEAKERRANAVTQDGGEDPDIAGIRPGPQPLPEQWYHGNDNQLEQAAQD